MSNVELCIKDEIKNLSKVDQELFLRVTRSRGFLINKGTKEKPNWMFLPGVCLKHKRGCSAPTEE